MKTTRPFAARIVALAAGIVLAGVSASEAQFDHLKCYKIRDTTRSFVANSHALDLLSDEPSIFPDEACNVKVKAKFYCTDVDKQNVVPAPPGAPDGPQPGDFLCYKFKGRCTPSIPSGTTLNVVDQFASGSIGLIKAGMLCAPANVIAPPTTTTTSTTVTTTTLPGLTCNASAPPTCGGDCPVGQTCFDIGGFCFCFLDSHIPCAEDAPTCGVACPGSDVCVPGIGGAACFCVPSTWETCGDSAPTCDGACPVGFECNPGAVVCQCDPI
jgi:hypothetical protein